MLALKYLHLHVLINNTFDYWMEEKYARKLVFTMTLRNPKV